MRRIDPDFGSDSNAVVIVLHRSEFGVRCGSTSEFGEKRDGRINMKIAVIGAGYVGLATGVCLADFGHQVHVVDINEDRVASLKQGKSPIFEPGLDRLLTANITANRLTFSTQLSVAAHNASGIFIAVSTPSTDTGDANLSYLFTAVDQVAEVIGAQYPAEPVVLVIKSTVPVGTCTEVTRRLREKGILESQCVVVSNPEFLREGSAISDCMSPDRVVLGATTPVGFDRMLQLYHPYVAREVPFVKVALEAAEHIKYASNAFLAVKISFINELALVCEKTNTDVLEVARGMGLDSRIGLAFLMPGPGFGGSCFPKDIKSLAAVGAHHGVETQLLTAVEAINRRQKQHIVDRVLAGISGISQPVVAVLGLAFKANTDDMRDAPSLDIVPALLENGVAIQAYDAVAAENAKPLLGERVRYCDGASDAIVGADLVLVLTEWNEFYDMDLAEIKRQMRGVHIVDARRVIDPEQATAAGFVYYGIGRA